MKVERIEQKVCEVCEEAVAPDTQLCGCEFCGRLFAPCCNSEEDSCCVECAE